MGSPELLESTSNFAPKRIEIVGATVGKPCLGVRPHRFVGIELGRIRRKRLQMKTGEAATQFTNAIALVDTGVVPEHDHGAGKMPEKMREERTHFVMPDVMRMTLEVEPDPLAPRRHRDPGDDRDSISAIAVPHDGCVAARCPRFSQRWNQEEARFIDEDEIGAQPCSVFFTRGHFWRFQDSMAFSLRSSARRSGF